MKIKFLMLNVVITDCKTKVIDYAPNFTSSFFLPRRILCTIFQLKCTLQKIKMVSNIYHKLIRNFRYHLFVLHDTLKTLFIHPYAVPKIK